MSVFGRRYRLYRMGRGCRWGRREIVLKRRSMTNVFSVKLKQNPEDSSMKTIPWRRGAFLSVVLGLFLIPTASAQEAELGIETYAGLTITGEVGKVYSVEYVNEVGAEDWKCLEFVQLLESPYLWTDKSAPVREKRFYRAVQMDAPEGMVWIPPGTFRMGSPTNEVYRVENEGPQTEVTISRGFFMGKCEVTQGEWLSVLGDNTSHFNGIRHEGTPSEVDYGTDLSRPVDYAIGWEDYCHTLTVREREAGRIPANCEYRLPTEAQWEYACRALTSTRYSYGNDPDGSQFSDYAWYPPFSPQNDDVRTHGVGQKLPNPWGLYDMHGNIAELCSDFFADSLPGGRAVDPSGPSMGDSRALRVGLGSARRYPTMPDSRDWVGVVGFRVVLAPVVFRPQPNMVYIPPGTFLMGSPEDEQDRISNEGPQTQVTLTQGFWMGKYEVTQEEYETLIGENPSSHAGEANLPVESVSWNEAVAYCEALSQQERAAGRIPSDYSYRLPSETEWEYACRAGTTTRFSYGDDPEYTQLGEYAWYFENSGDQTHPVGQKLANPWGLYDMHGNVYEWCLGFSDFHLPGGTLTDPQLSAERFRSSSFLESGFVCRSADRCCDGFPDVMGTNVKGLRIVLSRVRQ
jgi:formylglycine-generating enzyme required for sulfatase activity